MPTRPVIDHGRCEAKRDCVRVCPYDVFEVRRMDAEDFTALGMLGKLRSTAHRRMTAYTVRADQCHECGLCVTAALRRRSRWCRRRRSQVVGPKSADLSISGGDRPDSGVRSSSFLFTPTSIPLLASTQLVRWAFNLWLTLLDFHFAQRNAQRHLVQWDWHRGYQDE